MEIHLTQTNHTPHDTRGAIRVTEEAVVTEPTIVAMIQIMATTDTTESLRVKEKKEHMGRTTKIGDGREMANTAEMRLLAEAAAQPAVLPMLGPRGPQ